MAKFSFTNTASWCTKLSPFFSLGKLFTLGKILSLPLPKYLWQMLMLLHWGIFNCLCVNLFAMQRTHRIAFINLIVDHLVYTNLMIRVTCLHNKSLLLSHLPNLIIAVLALSVYTIWLVPMLSACIWDLLLHAFIQLVMYLWFCLMTIQHIWDGLFLILLPLGLLLPLLFATGVMWLPS